MGDIAVPHSLSNANAGLSLAESLAKLLDPAERKKIADDVRSFNALNETEAKQAKEARELIKKNGDILDETRKTEGRIAKEKKDFEQEKKDFASSSEAEKQKIAILKSEAEAEQEKSKKLLNQIELNQNTLNDGKRDLAGKIDQYKRDSDKLANDRKKADDDLKESDRIKAEAENLLKSTKEKIAKLREHNL